MASFHAKLEVGGRTYPVRTCSFEFTQATNERGRAAAKVRHGLLHLTLDVPDDALLLDWGTAAHKPLDGHVTFFETDRRTARETVSFTAGACVGYHEVFVGGNAGAGAYVCQLTIAAQKLELAPGGPTRAFVPAAAREYAPTEPLARAARNNLAPSIQKKAIQAGVPANPMNPERMKLWMNYLERRGIRFLIGTPEAQLKLYDNSAEGLFTSGGTVQTVYLHDPPSTAAFFEEVFHALQHLRNHPATRVLDDGTEVDAWEYDAKTALLRHSEKLGLSYEEYLETEKQLQQVIDNEYGNY